VHLDQPVLVGRRPIDDQEDEVVIILELRPLPEVLRIFECERMELEDIAEYGEVFLAWPG
jgi:hypothetical protein